MKVRRMMAAATVVAATLFLLTVGASRASADTFTFTSCHIDPSCGTATNYGTGTLTQSGTSVTFDVVLTSGNRFVETGAGGGELFLFNDVVSGSTITNITATLNGANVTSTISGGLSGFTNLSPVHADGTGDFTASVECTTVSSCNGGSTPNINDLEFTVTNATLAQLATANALGNIFVADILCGQTGCGGQTGPVDSSSVSHNVPDGGMTIMLLGGALLGLTTLRRRFRV